MFVKIKQILIETKLENEKIFCFFIKNNKIIKTTLSKLNEYLNEAQLQEISKHYRKII
jgi:hypothetical protein